MHYYTVRLFISRVPVLNLKSHILESVVQYKSQGMSNTDQRQIRLKQELDRVRGYLKKIKAAETRGQSCCCFIGN